MAEPYLSSLTEKIAALGLQSSAEVALESKHFFQGAALYANSRICASLTPAGFGVKLPPKIRRRLLDDGDATELRYFAKAPIKKEYVALSESVSADPEVLKALLEMSVVYVTGMDTQAK